ncbi:hypothetical protein BDP27DRAFT_1409752 [Rhodocollybia butyracea]|uniref:JmjC domain-containing protein n=1 Tax=Rhodocollybia butyracea TaxID=206335 RepID=A0A9P5TX64_9AGAR|nr:hypothetical protein BDP27DRAFT_1409752 [Rhodocollybia butyracea]
MSQSNTPNSTDLSDATLMVSKSRTVKGQNIETIYSTSPAAPAAMRFQYYTICNSPNPKIGYLHLNTTSKRYWVFDGSDWKEKPEGQTFFHPSAHSYTWDTHHLHWITYNNNKYPISIDNVEGNENKGLRKMTMKNSKATNEATKKNKATNEDAPEAGPSTHIQKKQKIYPDPSRSVYNENMTPVEKIQALWDPDSCRHLGIREQVAEFLQLLSNQPVYSIDMQDSGALLTKAPTPVMKSPFDSSMIWTDLAVDVRKATIGSLGMTVTPSLGKLMANFFDRELLVEPLDPYYSIIECWPSAARDGLRDLGIRWESSTIIFGPPNERPATLTQPGSITSAHRDGFGYGIRIYQARGSKVWVVWPPTDKNLSWIFRNLHQPDYHPEHLLKAYMSNMEDMQVYLVQKGDCFDVSPLTIHCCLSLDTSIHIAVSTWSLQGLEIAKMVNKKMINWWPQWKKLNKETKDKEKEELQKGNQGVSNMAPQIAEELAWQEGARNIFLRGRQLCSMVAQNALGGKNSRMRK